MSITETDVCEEIRSKVREACGLSCFTDWLGTISIDPGDLLLINNSFFFRYKVETSKNSQYLSLLMRDGSVESSEVRVATGISINSDFKHLKNKSNLPTITDLDEAVRNEILRLGKLVFILIGELDASLEFTQQIHHSMFNSLILRPRLETNLAIDGKTIFVKDLISEELLWSELEIKVHDAGLVTDRLPDSLIRPFAKSIKELRKNCYINLALPVRGEISDHTFLDSIIHALKKNAHQYRESLEKWRSASYEQQEFNNLLRIAYNFSGEAVTMLRLLVSICDLKPLVLWMTIKEQIELTEAFRRLPWARTKEKPSLDDYIELIHGARNRSFHNLLPFNHTIMVQLEGVPIAARHLRLFPEYTSARSKVKNALEYEDRQLVEILAEFTRSEQRYVTPDFWQRNLDVMDATINLLAATSNTLKILNDIE